MLLLLVGLSQVGYSQSKIDSVLYQKIAIMFKQDQKWRIEYANLSKPGGSAYNEKTINSNWLSTDSSNLAEAKRIIKNFGYPGYTLAGKGGSNMFWAIIQHSDEDVKFQQQVLALMDKEVKRHNASGENYAYLKDRILINLGQRQLYGTQTSVDLKTRKHTAFPVQDQRNLESRRKSVGLKPLKEYLKWLDDNF